MLSYTATFCAGSTTDGSIICYIKKEDNKNLPSFAVLDERPVTYTFRKGGGLARHQQTLLCFSQCIVKSITNMSIARPPSDGDISFEQLCKALARFSSDELTVIKCDIEISPRKSVLPSSKRS